MSGKNPLGVSKEPQSYEGVNFIVPIGGSQIVKAKRDPNSNDKKYPITTQWINTVNNNTWILTSVVNGSPTWVNDTGYINNDVTGTSATMAPNNQYIADNASLVTLTLPVTATQGAEIQVIGNGAGGWTIAQNAGQTIHMNAVNTTTGTGGSLSSSNRYNCVMLRCTVANTDWVVVNSSGTLTAV